MTRIIGWLLGLDHVDSIDDIEVALAAPWAQDGLFWLCAGCAVFVVLSVIFYLRFQTRGSRAIRLGLAISRGLLLSLLLVTLAYPVLRITSTRQPSPLLYFVFDGTDSMAIEDELAKEQRDELLTAVGREMQPAAEGGQAEPLRSRMDYVRALVACQQDNLVDKLHDKDLRLEAFLFDGSSTSQLRRLELGPNGDDKLDRQHLASQLTDKGQVTAIGAVLDDLAQQFGSSQLAGVVLFSDFAHNSGLAPVGRSGGNEQSPASRLGVPLFTVGVGPASARDLAVDLQPPPRMKKGENTTIAVKLSQTGMEDQTCRVRVTARRLQGDLVTFRERGEIVVGEESVTFSQPVAYVEMPFNPADAGRFEFSATVEPMDGEVIDENNRSTREVNVIDDYLRLMYIEYEPTWEWRFVKEVFHRDRAVGMRGFRTFLRSADPKVRQYNDLFLPTLTPKRSVFFANDVIFLGDMPASALSDRFCEMTKEFVSRFGGGLVVIAGPRFGPGQLAETPLSDMLPVKVNSTRRLTDDRQFRPHITPTGLSTDFMQLGDVKNEDESVRAWQSLGQLTWYQPVDALHSQADVLMEHPTDTCADGKTRQPLIAIRPYGSNGGEVVYLGFNEFWRLRRKYGERYYRQFWSQIMHRLSLSHALGEQKRFVLRSDRKEYRAEERVVLTVEAFDVDFEPLSEANLADRKLMAEVIVPGRLGEAPYTREIPLPQLREGVFEARIPVYTAGEYHVRVKDPVTGNFTEERFRVRERSAERRSAIRNVRLQQQLASTTGGKAYDLANVADLVDDLQLERVSEHDTRIHALWCTPLWFGVAVLLMLGEWFFRKMNNLV
jgi:hypothetical protein